jgi:Spy/CpxP family protein refolding chaperone
MKKSTKKIALGLAVVALIASIGAVFASAQTDGTSEDIAPECKFWYGPRMNGHGPFNSNSTENGFFFYDLTEEQQAQLDELITSLKDQGANSSEIQATIQEKLDEYGVFDQRLENEINQTEQRLQMLNREKDLREQGYSWDEIRTIIQDEFGLEYPIAGDDHGMIGRRGFGRGPCGSPDGFMPGEEN